LKARVARYFPRLLTTPIKKCL